MALDPRLELVIRVAQFEAELTAIAWRIMADVMQEEMAKPYTPPKKREPRATKETRYHELLYKPEAGLWTRDGKVFYRCVEVQDSYDDPVFCKMLSRDGKKTRDVKLDTIFNRWQFFPEKETP